MRYPRAKRMNTSSLHRVSAFSGKEMVTFLMGAAEVTHGERLIVYFWHDEFPLHQRC